MVLIVHYWIVNVNEKCSIQFNVCVYLNNNKNIVYKFIIKNIVFPINIGKIGN